MPTADNDARCSRCDEVVGTTVIEGGRATIRLSTSSHGDALPITCPRVIPPGLHGCVGCGVELDADDAHDRCDECVIPPVVGQQS